MHIHRGGGAVRTAHACPPYPHHGSANPQGLGRHSRRCPRPLSHPYMKTLTTQPWRDAYRRGRSRGDARMIRGEYLTGHVFLWGSQRTGLDACRRVQWAGWSGGLRMGVVGRLGPWRMGATLESCASWATTGNGAGGRSALVRREPPVSTITFSHAWMMHRPLRYSGGDETSCATDEVWGYAREGLIDAWLR